MCIYFVGSLFASLNSILINPYSIILTRMSIKMYYSYTLLHLKQVHSKNDGKTDQISSASWDLEHFVIGDSIEMHRLSANPVKERLDCVSSCVRVVNCLINYNTVSWWVKTYFCLTRIVCKRIFKFTRATIEPVHVDYEIHALYTCGRISILSAGIWQNQAISTTATMLSFK